MKKFLFSVLVAAVFSVAHAAEDFTLWNSQVFTGPFTGGVIATSVVVTNNNGFDSVKIALVYEDGAPAPDCQCLITAVVEEEISPTVWIPLAPQHEAINTQFNAPNRIIIATPQQLFSPGVDEYIDANGGTRISTTTASAPDKMRVKITVTEFGPPLTSLTLSAHGRKYNLR